MKVLKKIANILVFIIIMLTLGVVGFLFTPVLIVAIVIFGIFLLIYARKFFKD